MRGDAATDAGRCVLFWDYDTQWGADRSRSARGGTSGHLEFAATDRILEHLDRYGLRACFAVVGAAALPGTRPYHDPAQIRRIAEAGHEIASHAMYHEWLPALPRTALRDTLRASRTALEQCTGRPVRTFVPPFNQPFDCLAKLAPSLTERRTAGAHRVSLPQLCGELRVIGYRVCRVAYRSVAERLAAWAGGSARPLTRAPVRIAGLACVRVTGFGFGADGIAAVERAAATGGLAAVYAHPHSLWDGGPQDERALAPFLRRLAALRGEGRMTVVLPGELAVAGTREARCASAS